MSFQVFSFVEVATARNVEVAEDVHQLTGVASLRALSFGAIGAHCVVTTDTQSQTCLCRLQRAGAGAGSWERVFIRGHLVWPSFFELLWIGAGADFFKRVFGVCFGCTSVMTRRWRDRTDSLTASCEQTFLSFTSFAMPVSWAKTRSSDMEKNGPRPATLTALLRQWA